MSKYKGEIINLRKQGKSYDEIKDELGCAKSTISYHCKQEGLEKIGLQNDYREKKASDKKKEKIKNHYKEHTAKETAKKFNISKSSVQRHGDKKDTLNVDDFDREIAKKDKLFEEGSTDAYAGNHKQGTLAEQLFITEAIKRGYNVCKPLIECRYDFILDNGEKTKKVQVKSTKQKSRDGRGYILSLTSKCRHSNPQRRYSRKKVDAVIGYLFDEDVFVYIPPEIFENRGQVTLRKKAKINHPKVNFLDDYIW